MVVGETTILVTNRASGGEWNGSLAGDNKLVGRDFF